MAHTSWFMYQDGAAWLDPTSYVCLLQPLHPEYSGDLAPPPHTVIASRNKWMGALQRSCLNICCYPRAPELMLAHCCHVMIDFNDPQ